MASESAAPKSYPVRPVLSAPFTLFVHFTLFVQGSVVWCFLGIPGFGAGMALRSVAPGWKECSADVPPLRRGVGKTRAALRVGVHLSAGFAGACKQSAHSRLEEDAWHVRGFLVTSCERRAQKSIRLLFDAGIFMFS